MSSGSPAIDLFASAASAANPAFSAESVQAPDSYRADVTEKLIVQRAITAAFRAASRALGEDPPTKLIRTGEDAFTEHVRFRLTSEDPHTLEITRRLADVLLLAADELGPFKGGRPGSFKTSGKAPNVVERFEPAPAMLQKLAAGAGTVVGLASTTHDVDLADEIGALRDGCPICGAPIALTGASHQEISPTEGPQIESGQCSVEHRLEREVGLSEWKVVGPRKLWAT